MDREGWVRLSALRDVLESTNIKNVVWSPATVAHLIAINNRYQRFEVTLHTCRATYGHSCQQFDPAATAIPNAPLYHGTHVAACSSILQSGLQPMNRRFVQLTTDLAYAISIADNHLNAPAIFQIASTSAIEAGVKFYSMSNHVWLSTSIDPHFLQPWLTQAPDVDDFPFLSNDNY